MPDTDDVSHLFRQVAIDFQSQLEEGSPTIKTPSGWPLAGSLIGLCFVFAIVWIVCVARIDHEFELPGTLKPSVDLPIIVAQSAGTIERLDAQLGSRVKAGASLFRIASPRDSAEYVEARNLLEGLVKEARDANDEREFFNRQKLSLQTRARLLDQEIASLERSAALAARKLAAQLELRRNGLSSDLSALDAQDAAEGPQRQLQSALQARTQIDQEVASLEAQYRVQSRQQRSSLVAANARVERLASSGQTLLVQAPSNGIIDALYVHDGDVVQAGQKLARLSAESREVVAICFVPAAVRQHLTEGQAVRVEVPATDIDSPIWLTGVVGALSRDAALADDPLFQALPQAIRPTGPVFRAEVIRLLPKEAAAELRAGTDAKLHVRTGQERLIGVLFPKAREWFP